MYGFLRQRAQSNSQPATLDYTKLFEKKTVEEILMGSLSAYMGIVSDKYMFQFFKVLYSERSTSKTAATVMVEETERMISKSRDLFYALAVHGKIKNEQVDTVAMTYALTMHSLIDYRMDRITAGQETSFGDGKSPVPKNMIEFIRWLSSEIGIQ